MLLDLTPNFWLTCTYSKGRLSLKLEEIVPKNQGRCLHIDLSDRFFSVFASFRLRLKHELLVPKLVIDIVIEFVCVALY